MKSTKKTEKILNNNRYLFLPINRNDMNKRGWNCLDFLFVTADAYVDHPSFAHAILTRCLEAVGYRVGIISQPDWKSTKDFEVMGRPRFAVFVSGGNIDSMVSHYTAARKKRHTDSYTPGGMAGKRPDRATIVYCNRIRELWKDIPIIIGGIEASLRRFAHYDYWSDSVRKSILIDSKADVLAFGMGELSIVEIANIISSDGNLNRLRSVRGIMWKTHEPDNAKDAVEIPSFEEVKSNKKLFADAFAKYYSLQDFVNGKRIIQNQGPWYVVQNLPSRPLTEAEMDKIYSYPYTMQWHPDYDRYGGVPALKEVKFSIVSHRGCYGECAFCAIALHQGRIIQRRSDASIIAEAEKMMKMNDFKGYINDVGGPAANFTIPSCVKQLKYGVCQNKSCIFPKPCPSLRADHSDYLALLKKLRALPGIKKVFIRSGIRYDYILQDKKTDFLTELCKYHVSGQLKIAPEHVSAKVLSLMRKPGREVTEEFIHRYRELNDKLGVKQFLVPYFISSHPGATLSDAVELAEFIRDEGIRPEQVQDFTPTPGSASTCMYYTGIDPFTGHNIYVAKTDAERKMQRALMQYWMPENRGTVLRALAEANRTDLIGFDKKCLVRPKNSKITNIKTSKNRGQRQ